MSAKPNTPPLGVGMRAGVGFRYRQVDTDTEPDSLKRLRRFDVADISDMTNRMCVMSAAISLVAGPARLAGTACTVRVALGDNLMLQKALDIVRPGQILVVDANRSERYAVLGELITLKARSRGVAGVIVDGMVRDIDEIRKLDFPVFARGVTANGPTKHGPGEINYPVSCGGIVVHPGDLILGDSDGVLALSQEDAVEVADAVEARADGVRAYRDRLRGGEVSLDWVDRILDAYPGVDQS
ncbi:RraA family protein [Rhodobacterales bacterium HKCCE3408]|nr:RraA family protein [Rhodobacterales bacterium HKCCE3408]